MIEHAYIHIPFCIKKCKYCSFVSGFKLEYKEAYINSLLTQIKILYKGEKLKTLYLGGGTPSLLNVEDVNKIINSFDYKISPEITIEVNPETVTSDKIKGYRDIGINRISIGIQTFDDEILLQIGRNHSASQAKKAVEIIRSTGFNNISIDLIYGLNNQTLKNWENDLAIAKELDIEHLSAYGLKIEKGSYFYKNRPNNLPDDEQQAKMYEFLCDYFSNLNHYEISNFAKYGYESKHNCAYWQNKEYYGLGINASGFEGNLRYKNISKLKEYLKYPLEREEKYTLTEQENMENEIFLALRLKTGIDTEKINRRYNIDFNLKYGNIINKYEKIGLLESKGNNIKLTRRGILLSNEIMAEFLEV